MKKPDRWELLRESDAAELWLWEKPFPDGSDVATLWRGRVYVTVNGRRLQTPKDPIFQTRAEGDAWFEKQSS